MTQVTVDEAAADQIRSATDGVELVDSAGKPLGELDADAAFDRRIRKVPSPFTREQTEEHRKQTGGKSLAEIKARLTGAG